MTDQPGELDGNRGFLSRFQQNLKGNDDFPIYFYFGLGLTVVFLLVVSLAPTIGVKLGIFSKGKTGQQSFAQGISTSAKAASNTLIVGSGGYPSIQGSINAAAGGDIISIHAGSYSEQVALNKGVTLQPYGDGAVVIDGGCLRTYGIDITASGATVRGLTVQNTVSIGILMSGGVAHTTLAGNTVQNFDCKWTPSTPTSAA